MRLPLTIIVLIATTLSCAAQLVSPRPATVMFSNSGSFVVKVNREPWLRGSAGAATPGWKQAFVQNDANAGAVTKHDDRLWDFSGSIGPEAAPNAAWLSYRQRLSPIGETLQINWRFRMARAMELDLLYVSLALPAKRFAGKTIRFDRHDIVLPERAATGTQRPITGRPQRIVIDSGSLGSIAIRFDKPQVVWLEDRRPSGGDDFELRILLATGELQTGDEYGLALQLELAERPELLVGGNGREYQNDTTKWLRFDLQDTEKPVTDPQRRALTDASALLHTPAGKFGVLQTKGGHFVWSNGARQKFWGVRLTPAAAPAKENAEAAAVRMAQFGVNLVRWTVSASPPDKKELDHFDHFAAALARRGIYSLLVLPDERSAEAWLLRQNSATGRRCVDDPALAIVQVAADNPLSQRAPSVNDLPVEFYNRLLSHLRKIGVKCPIIAGDSAPLSTTDAVSVSASWDPVRPDGFVENKSLVSSDGGYLPLFASASFAHKPLLITRITHSQPNEQRAEAPLLLAAHAALQDWDGVIWDNYNNDPAIFGQFPVAARVFLGNLVSPSKLNTYVLRADAAGTANPLLPSWLTFISRWRNALPNVAVPTPDILIGPDAGEPQKNARPTKPVRLAAKAADNPIALQRLWVDAARKLRAPLGWEEGPRREFGSDNGQLTWDQDHGQFTIFTPTCVAALGFIGGKTVALGDVTFDVGSPRFAAVSLLALDGNPIVESRRLLLTTVARCENTDQRWFENLNGNLKVLDSKPGARLEPVTATITLRSPRAFKMFVLNPAGQRTIELSAKRDGDSSTCVINGLSMFYELVVEGGLRLWPF